MEEPIITHTPPDSRKGPCEGSWIHEGASRNCGSPCPQKEESKSFEEFLCFILKGGCVEKMYVKTSVSALSINDYILTHYTYTKKS